ncbi:protein maelstrom homolog [Centruroides sculpturatus]|uniref:protein maelstrom homolog n=1 Tax=Centruroides sculpturatus TaxID=218467 RepID=UPI000C6E1BCB|nr:protein maelstrom homolog [Centruroides sculpturatus]XP_023227004.1 protein maelstrom homolog [Centruroides sculpturatus]
MPKKQRNAFYFFMKELQEEYRAEGKNISMKEMAPIAHPLWKDLPESERIKYETMAREYKNEAKDCIAGKMCSDGTPLDDVYRAEREEQEKAEEAVKFVERYIFRMDSVDEVKNTPFFIMVFNVLCCTDDNEYIPLEVGITKYSIKEGIEDYFHTFIDAGRIPIGYSRAAMQHSDETHKIPTLKFELSESNYLKICKSIERFVESEGKEIAPVFCLEENIKQNQGCLDWLCKKANYYNIQNVQYYSLVNLLMELRAYVDNAFPCKVVAADMLTSHAYDYAGNIRCDYHETLDNMYCALGCAKRFCFLLSDAVCQFYDVDCTSKHLPPRIDDGTDFETYQPALPPPLPVKNIVNVPVKPPKSHVITTIIKKDTANNNIPHDVQANSNTPSYGANRPDIVLSNDDFPSLNESKPKKDNSEMRQPNTLPFVLFKGLSLNQDKRFAASSLGRGIGRGKQIP